MAVVWEFLCKIFYCVVGIPVLLFTWGALYIGQLLGIASCAGAGLPTAKWVEDSFSLQLDGAILEEAWDKTFEDERVQKALKVAEESQQPIHSEQDESVKDGSNDEQEDKGSPQYIKYLATLLDNG